MEETNYPWEAVWAIVKPRGPSADVFVLIKYVLVICPVGDQ